MVYYFYCLTSNKRRAILSLSAKEPGRLQITYFFYGERTGMWLPTSDSIRDSIRECLNQLEDEGFQREKIKRFNLFEKPEAFTPSNCRPRRLRGRENYWMKAFGIDQIHSFECKACGQKKMSEPLLDQCPDCGEVENFWLNETLRYNSDSGMRKAQ